MFLTIVAEFHLMTLLYLRTFCIRICRIVELTEWLSQVIWQILE